MPEPTRYAVVGTGGRASMFIHALFAEDLRNHGRLVALCDVNQTRMDHYNQEIAERHGAAALSTWKPHDFAAMIRAERVDTVIVTTVDRLHHHYIVRAMDAGCDVISEKPMTVDAAKCQEILDAIERTGRKLRVTFNYRYAPRNSKVRELIRDGVIGDVTSVHFEWLLDTRHGADYFRRWHRDKRNSGGLLVHKSTHHFDLVNWWLDDVPERVYAVGDLVFYGRENAEQRGVTRFYERGTSEAGRADPFGLDLAANDTLKALYLEAEHEDGYRRDQSVFADGISIEDDVAVLVRYQRGTSMTYHLTAYSPWEGYRIAFNGTRGRLEYDVAEKSYVSGSEGDANRPDIRDAVAVDLQEPARILIRPHWSPPLEVQVESGGGGHGGGDVRLLRDLFIGDGDDPLGRAADHRAGAHSILTGIAANRSMATGRPVAIDTLVSFRSF